MLAATFNADLIGLIYDAVADASRWHVFLEACIKALGAQKGNLSFRDAVTPQFPSVCTVGFTAQDMRLYTEVYVALDPWAGPTARWPEGVVGVDTDLCSRAEMEASVAYREWYLPRGAVHGIGSTILMSPTAQSVITMVRDTAGGPFGETERAMLRPLMPHLKRAAILHSEFGTLRRQLDTFTGHLERYPYAFLLTDLDARILYANAAARELAAARDGLAIEEGKLVAHTRTDNSALRDAARSLVKAPASIRRLEISRPSGRNPYLAILMPIEDSKTMPLGVSTPGISVLITGTESRLEPDMDVLRQLYSLTPAEARVTVELVLGRSIEEIAANSSASITTVRTHVKRVLSKTGTARQGELISTILRSVPFRPR